MHWAQQYMLQGGLVKKSAASSRPTADAPVAISQSSTLGALLVSAQLVEQHWRGSTENHFPDNTHVHTNSWLHSRFSQTARLPTYAPDVHNTTDCLNIFAEVDLDSKRKAWEESCLEIAEVQEKSATSRKNLAAETKGTVHHTRDHHQCMKADFVRLFHAAMSE
jgi:hypothetical protein